MVYQKNQVILSREEFSEIEKKMELLGRLQKSGVTLEDLEDSLLISATKKDEVENFKDFVGRECK